MALSLLETSLQGIVVVVFTKSTPGHPGPWWRHTWERMKSLFRKDEVVALHEKTSVENVFSWNKRDAVTSVWW